MDFRGWDHDYVVCVIHLDGVVRAGGVVVAEGSVEDKGWLVCILDFDEDFFLFFVEMRGMEIGGGTIGVEG